MRLFTLFISYANGGHYCGVYPSLEYLHGPIHEMAEDERIDKSEIPDLKDIQASVTGNNSEDFWHVFSNGAWIHVQETSEQLVEVILDNYFEKFYSDLAEKIDLKVASLPKDKEQDAVIEKTDMS